MPASPRKQTVQSPTSPTIQPAAKYTNKDGSKFITVPKALNTVEPPETSAAMAQTTTKPNGQMPTTTTSTNGAPTVNRKKAKRRQKQAAKLAAEQPADSPSNGAQSPGEIERQMQELAAQMRNQRLGDQYGENGQFDPVDDQDSDEAYDYPASPPNGYPLPTNPPGKKSRKKKKGKNNPPQASEHVHHGANGLSQNHVSLPLPPLASTNMPRGPGISKEKIWNTSSQEERERIKEFWLSLGEDERKSLVKVEKDAVLKKMKEQQKHSCSCTVCGRKRTAIEEELEVLYDAYYEELEQYANHQGDGPPHMLHRSAPLGAISGWPAPNHIPPQRSQGRIEEEHDDEDDEEEDEQYSDEEEEDDISEDEPEEIPRSHATDFFNFGNSLTVQGGILTVADDLLKNDGKKFIEMMEQLAERRMAREEDARVQYASANYGHPPNGALHPHSHNHSHAPEPEEDEYDDDEDGEEEYDSQDEDYDEEEMDTMTEEQRMEEGRRMFQIFAARMFEQRVLTAYKEKVAKERQQKLLEELEEESKMDSQKKAKKAKDAQKKKDKLAQKKQALAEEKAKRDAEKAAQEAALRAAEEKKLEEQRMKAEEKRRKKEATKKAEEEERLRKETEKQRRLQEQRDRQSELERKQREAKEKERKEKEELRQKEKEAKETKEREAKERKERLEKEKRDKDAKVKAEKDAKDRQSREDAAQKAAAQAAISVTQNTKRQHPPVPIPTNLQPHAMPSPHIPVATPAIPKAPTPIKLRTSSQQDSNSSIPQTPQNGGLSQNVSPVPTTPSQGSPGRIGPPGKNQSQPPFLHHPQAVSPIHAALKSPPGMGQPGPFGGMPQMNLGFQQPGMPMMGPGYGGRMHHDPMFPHQQPIGPFRPMGVPNGMPMHPMAQGRGFPMHGPPGFPQQMPGNLGGIGQIFGAQKENIPSQSHSRQQSGTFDKGFEGGPPTAQPIARPAPIGRPSSVVHGQRRGDGKTDMDDLNSHLGSSALLDDSDEPLNSGSGARQASGVPGNVNRQSFGPISYGLEPPAFGSPIPGYNTWGAPPNPFAGPSSLPGANYLGGWGPPPNSSFGSVGGNQGIRQTPSRPVAVRLMICRACKNLEGSTPDGFYNINAIKEQVDHINPPTESPVTESELLDICETEGNAINGGGSFDIRKDGSGQHSIRHENDVLLHRQVGAPGEIGSPIVGSGGISRFPGPPPGF